MANKILSMQITLLTFVLRYLKQKTLYLVIFVLVSIVWSVEVSLVPYLLKIIIDTVNKFSNDGTKLLRTLSIPVILYSSISLISNINYRIYEYTSLKLYPRLKADIIKDMYAYLIKHSDAFFQNNFSGSLTKKLFDMTTNIELLIRTVHEVFLPVICALIISSVTLLITVHPIFAIILILWAVLFVFISYAASMTLANYSKELAESNTKASSRISDSISAITTVKLFAADNYEISSINNDLECAVQADCKVHWQNLKINFIQGLGVTILIACMLLALVYGYIQNLITVGDFALVLSLSISIFTSIYNIGRQIQQFAKMGSICRESLSIMQEVHEIVDLPDAKIIKVRSGSIEFRDVSFGYKSNQNLFSTLNIKIKPREKVGLVGYSGGGKSTFIKLILRLIEPQSGEVLIDHQDIKTVTLHSLISQLTVIPQEPCMFHRTIMENIRIAKPGATDQEVIAAAKNAKCHDFINELPEGYESLVGERGTKLSGGQRQRIAIARAFLKNSGILLFDEPTSALDSITESDIQDSINHLIQNKTTIVIAHRLSTLKHLDRILVFDHGTIIEDGDLKTLLSNKNGVFLKLWKMQVGGFIDSGLSSIL